MPAAAAEHPWDGPPESQLETADRLMEQLPGYRVEIIGGVIAVTPPADGAHALDRKHSRLHVLTDPVGADYANHRIHAPGEQVVLPESIGAEVKLDVSAMLKAGEPRKAS
ncbi:hypothetical protein P3L51_16850 [Streptomyces sp. PSRA5]|uniref:hypothetical protein n=1 Tax=Streptomyces panacea TaxID=3035064 RepID=UPI00339BCEFA